MQLNTNDRNKTIDVLRGIAIFCVVLGHIVQKGMLDIRYEDNVVYKAIYTFHMPMLMLLSGYLFYYSIKKYSFLELLKHKVIQIALPIIVWNSMYYIIDIIFFNAIDMQGGGVHSIYIYGIVVFVGNIIIFNHIRIGRKL